MMNDKRQALRAWLDSTEASGLAASRAREVLLDLDFDSTEEVGGFMVSLLTAEQEAANHRHELMVFLLSELLGEADPVSELDLIGDWDADEELDLLVMSLFDEDDASEEEDGQ